MMLFVLVFVLGMDFVWCVCVCVFFRLVLFWHTSGSKTCSCPEGVVRMRLWCCRIVSSSLSIRETMICKFGQTGIGQLVPD